ncbi:hypothetical protein OAL44_01340 [Planctomycetaceae bacterium]|nr:hypothetical protein [Planctomycetaceae bacterium]
MATVLRDDPVVTSGWDDRVLTGIVNGGNANIRLCVVLTLLLGVILKVFQKRLL